MNRAVTQNGVTRRPDHRSDQKKEKCSVVYFGQVTSENREPMVNIGYSGSDYLSRERSHTNDIELMGGNYKTLCVVRALPSDEKALHRHFKRYQVPGGRKEFFWAAEEVADYVRWLRDRDFVYVPDDPQCADVLEHQHPDASLWMPGPERRKEPPQSNDLFDDFGPLRMPPRVVTGDDFYTHPELTDAARRAMGGIDLDPASHPIANREVKARRFFNIHDNGLTKSWAGRIWLNPPFGQWQAWVPKIMDEWHSGRIEAMCILCATRTITAQYFAPIIRGSAVCILFGRWAFWGPKAQSPDDGHVIFYFGHDLKRFKEAYGPLGTVKT